MVQKPLWATAVGLLKRSSQESQEGGFQTQRQQSTHSSSAPEYRCNVLPPHPLFRLQPMAPPLKIDPQPNTCISFSTLEGFLLSCFGTFEAGPSLRHFLQFLEATNGSPPPPPPFQVVSKRDTHVFGQSSCWTPGVSASALIPLAGGCAPAGSSAACTNTAPLWRGKGKSRRGCSSLQPGG